MATEVEVRKIGNSLGIILPKYFVEERHIKEKEKITIEVIREADLSNIFGTLKGKKISAQKFKDMAREGWEN